MLCIRPVISYVSNEQKMKKAQTLIISSFYLISQIIKIWYTIKHYAKSQNVKKFFLNI